VVTRTVEYLAEVFFDYSAMNSLMQLIKEEHLEIINSQFGLQCLIRIKVRSSLLEAIETKMLKTEGILEFKIVQE
jgi:putative IMPACT (imprinted ancient) family translation regulator